MLELGAPRTACLLSLSNATGLQCPYPLGQGPLAAAGGYHIKSLQLRLTQYCRLLKGAGLQHTNSNLLVKGMVFSRPRFNINVV